MQSSKNWYVVQTRPGSQLAARHYHVEKRFCKKTGRELKPKLVLDRDNGTSAIEAAMVEAGITCYMPAETRTIIHHRTKKPLERRFAMLPGYLFVHAVTDWPALEQVNGVECVLGIDGCPSPIPQIVIDQLKQAEFTVNQENAARERMRKEAAKPITRRRLQSIAPVGSKVKINHNLLGRVSGSVTDVTGRKAVKVALDGLKNLKPVEIRLDQILEVA